MIAVVWQLTLPTGEQRENTRGDRAEHPEALCSLANRGDDPSSHLALLSLVARLSLGSPWHDGLAQVTKLRAQPRLTDVCPSANHPMALSLDVFFIWVAGVPEWSACLQGVGSLTWATPFTPPNNLLRSSSLCRAGHGHREMLRDLPEVTQLASSRPGI